MYFVELFQADKAVGCTGTFANENGVYVGPDGAPLNREGLPIGDPGTMINEEGFIEAPNGTIFTPQGDILMVDNLDPGVSVGPDGVPRNASGPIGPRGTRALQDGTILGPEGLPPLFCATVRLFCLVSGLHLPFKLAVIITTDKLALVRRITASVSLHG